jgi:6,7-dimethyl-8-ribityllumazine synthase
VSRIDVPGALELPQAARAAALSRRFDAMVALGVVIRGETDHYEHVAREASAGLAVVARETLVPIGFGVLTVSDERHARARAAADPLNKGAEAARAAVSMVHVLRGLAAPRIPEARRSPTPAARAGRRRASRRGGGREAR